MGGSEHRICLSKGVIGKYVQRLELGARKSHRDGSISGGK
jgi:hypothetical protein